MRKELQTSEISQIHRLIGQLQGVEKMLSKKSKPTQIIQQLEAVRGNLKSLEKRILKEQIGNLSDPELKTAWNYLFKLG